MLVQEREKEARSAAEERALNDATAERITSLRRKSGLDGSSVTLLHLNDVKTPGAALVGGLDNQLRDRALSYYQSHTRRIKRNVPRLMQSAQAPLRARLWFKVAHFQEFRCRPHKALKYYTLAYTALQQAASMAVSSCSACSLCTIDPL